MRWRLTPGTPFRPEAEGAAWVAPVTDVDGGRAALKISFPHFEEEHEIDGLRFWDGDPSVRLLDADEESHAALIELCSPGTPLRELPEPDQDPIVANLLRRLWRRPPPSLPFRPLEAMLDYWSAEAIDQIAHAPDQGLVHEGIALFGELAATASTSVLLATDLHAGNVLRSTREAWLVIDPKPFIGDPAYDATQHLLNCKQRMREEPDRTIERFAGLLEVSSERVRLWTFARAAVASASEDRGEAERFRNLAAVLAQRGPATGARGCVDA